MSKVVHGAKLEFTLNNLSLGWFFFDHANRFADRICQIDASAGVSETYSSVKLRTIRAAIELQKRGITSNDVVALCCLNSLDTCIPIIASLYLGAKVVNLDPTLSLRNTTSLLQQVQPSLVFVDQSCLDLIEQGLTKAQIKAEIVVMEDGGGTQQQYPKLQDFIHPQPNEDKFAPVQVNSEDVAVMFFSSGTTGLPKAICHSHSSFLHLTEIADACGLRSDRILHFTTFYWISGMMMLTTTFFSGDTRVFAHDMEGANVLAIIEKHRVTSLFMAPIYTHNLTSVPNPDRFDTSSLTTILTGGTAISTEQVKRLDRTFANADVVFGYGMTETGMIAVFNPKYDRAWMKTKQGSCGKAAFEHTIKVVDVNTSEVLGPNQKGEIRVKSSSLMVGYYHQDSTDCFDSEGFLKTGDVGFYDEDECFYVIERIKEMFKYRSWHIVPSHLEAVLVEHPAVKEAVVFGIPARDEDGEVPAACVVLREDSCNVDRDEIERFMEERVSDVERLRGGVVFVEALPKTPSGKFMRTEIKQMAIKSM